MISRHSPSACSRRTSVSPVSSAATIGFVTLAIVAGMVAGGGTVAAQDSPAAAADSDSAADAESPDPPPTAKPGSDGLSIPPPRAPRLQLSSISFTGYSVVRPGRALTIRARVDNGTDESHQAVLIANLPGAEQVEFARRLTIERNSTHDYDLTLQMPDGELPPGFLEVEVSLRQVQDGREVLIAARRGEVKQSLPMSAESSGVTTAVAIPSALRGSFGWEWNRDPTDWPYQALVAYRFAANQNRNSKSLEAEALPTRLSAWDAFDNLIIGSPTALDDPAVTDTLRQWISGGGRAWIMLDLVPADLVRPLLSMGQQVDELDRTQLNNLRIEPTLAVGNLIIASDVSSETPLDFVRIQQRGGEVTHEINGFPAVVWMPIGRGEIVLTTLSARGLVHEAGNIQVRPDLYVPWVFHETLMPLARRFNQPRQPSSIAVQEFDYPVRRLGYQVVSRGPILTGLAIYCLGLTLTSVLLWRRGRAERMGWIAPGLAIVMMLPLLLIAALTNREVPATWSRFQLVDATSGSLGSTVEEQQAVYLADQVGSQWSSEDGGLPSVLSYQNSNVPRRWEWSGLESWNFRSPQWPAGVWRSQNQYPNPTAPAWAEGNLSDGGINIEIKGDLPSALEDAVLTIPLAMTAVLGSSTDNQFTATTADSFDSKNYIQAELLNSEQLRRQEVYQRILAPLPESIYPATPAVIGWTKTWSGGGKWTDGADDAAADAESKNNSVDSSLAESGAAVTILPFVLQPPPRNEHIMIPAALVRLESLSRNQIKAAPYWNAIGRWNNPFTNKIQIPMAFKLPVEVLPFSADRILIELRIQVAGRKVFLKSLAQENGILLGQWESPSGLLQIDITDPVVLADAADGSIDIEFTVDQIGGDELSSEDRAKLTAEWQIDYMRATVYGISID